MYFQRKLKEIKYFPPSDQKKSIKYRSNTKTTSTREAVLHQVRVISSLSYGFWLAANRMVLQCLVATRNMSR